MEIFLAGSRHTVPTAHNKKPAVHRAGMLPITNTKLSATTTEALIINPFNSKCMVACLDSVPLGIALSFMPLAFISKSCIKTIQVAAFTIIRITRANVTLR